MNFLILTADTPINAEQLKERYDDGWMLIHIVPWQGMLYFYFQRIDDVVASDQELLAYDNMVKKERRAMGTEEDEPA